MQMLANIFSEFDRSLLNHYLFSIVLKNKKGSQIFNYQSMRINAEVMV
jgi:hypothetical protein